MLLANKEINAKEVLVIGADGSQLGILKIADAMHMAADQNLDLVCVSQKEMVPTCKLMNFGKYKFELEKKEKAAKKTQHNSEISEVQFTYTIAEHDIETKVNTIKKLIEKKGNSVRIVLRLRGREKAMLDLAENKVNHIVSLCSEFSRIRKSLVVDQNDIIVVLEKKNKTISNTEKFNK